MKVRTLLQMVGAIVLVSVLALGSTMAPAPPAGADPADTQLNWNTMSKQYGPNGCLYKVMWGNYSTAPYARIHVYNLSACGGALVAVHYNPGTGVVVEGSTTVTGTGSDGCGAYQIIQATAPTSGIAVRALVWVGTYARFYAIDGTHNQPVHSTC